MKISFRILLNSRLKSSFSRLVQLLSLIHIFSDSIRDSAASAAASKVSVFPKVREQLVAMQKEIAQAKGYILDGRDIGTVVLPDAELKIYMVASVEARAKRRCLEYQQKQQMVSYETVYKDIEQRDYRDTHRAASPLKQADDAE